jgi:hypothetical protein
MFISANVQENVQTNVKTNVQVCQCSRLRTFKLLNVQALFQIQIQYSDYHRRAQFK